MAFRHRPKYEQDVPDRLSNARATYDKEMDAHNARVAKTRSAWSKELARAVESGMSYEEIVSLVGVSHSSVARAIREYRDSGPEK